jgi:hypothetical protein
MDAIEKSRMTLLLGRHNHKKMEEGHQLRTVKKIIRHPSFSLETFDYDFAVIG